MLRFLKLPNLLYFAGAQHFVLKIKYLSHDLQRRGRVSRVVNSRPNQSEITMTTKRPRISHARLWRHLPIGASESQELCHPRRSLAENTGSAFWFALRLLPFAQPLRWSWPTVKEGNIQFIRLQVLEIQSTESQILKGSSNWA